MNVSNGHNRQVIIKMLNLSDLNIVIEYWVAYLNCLHTFVNL